MSKYQYFFAMDAPTRLRPKDCTHVIGTLFPQNLMAYIERHSKLSNHHWNDVAHTMRVDTSPEKMDAPLLANRARFAYALSTAKVVKA